MVVVNAVCLEDKFSRHEVHGGKVDRYLKKRETLGLPRKLQQNQGKGLCGHLCEIDLFLEALNGQDSYSFISKCLWDMSWR